MQHPVTTAKALSRIDWLSDGRITVTFGVGWLEDVQKPHPPVWFGGDADPVLRRTARYASGWRPFLTRPGDIPARIDFIRSQPDHSANLAASASRRTTPAPNPSDPATTSADRPAIPRSTRRQE